MTPALPIGTLLPSISPLPGQSSGSDSGSDTLQAIENDIELQLLGGTGALTKPSQAHWTARIVTGALGFLLIAAAIFTHPTVVNIGKKAARAAGEAAAGA